MSARATLRRRCRERRAAMEPQARAHASLEIVRRLGDSPAFRAARRIALYWPVADEADVRGVLTLAASARQQCYLPVMCAGRTLSFLAYRSGEALVANGFGVPEPRRSPGGELAAALLDLVCVPLLGFDRAGNRLGQGGGYYDRSFAFTAAQPAAKPLLVGIAFACQELGPIDREPWDVPLDAVVTERELVDFRAGR